MFCNSDSCDSAICRPEPRSRPLVIETFYFLYSPFPVFIEARRETVRKGTEHRSEGGFGCHEEGEMGRKEPSRWSIGLRLGRRQDFSDSLYRNFAEPLFHALEWIEKGLKGLDAGTLTWRLRR
jgi:hypothetical protein